MATTHPQQPAAKLPAVLQQRLAEIRRRDSLLRLRRGLIDALAFFLAIMLVALVIDWSLTLFDPEVRKAITYSALAAGSLGLVVFVVLPQLRRQSLNVLAAQVDRSVASLEERWETVTEITTSANGRSTTGSPVMLKQVMKETIDSEPFVDPRTVVPESMLKKHRLALAGIVAAHAFIFLIDAPHAWVLVQRFWRPTAPVSLTQIKAVGGDLVVPRGEKIRLEAIVARHPQGSATLFLRNAQREVTTTSLSPANSEQTQFLYSIATSGENFDYRFRAGDGETAWHSVTVYDRPKLTDVQFRITSPDYTQLPPVEKSELPAKVRAVEGSTIEISFRVDQPLKAFTLELDPKNVVALEASAADPLVYMFKRTLTDSIRIAPVFVSQRGLENKRLPSCQVIVYADKAPQVTIVSPDKEISVRPDDVVDIEWNARDDFAVTRAEVIVYVGDAPDLANAVILPLNPAEPSSEPGRFSPAADAQPQMPTTAEQTAPANVSEGSTNPANEATSTDGKPSAAEMGPRQTAPDSVETKRDPAASSDDDAAKSDPNAPVKPATPADRKPSTASPQSSASNTPATGKPGENAGPAKVGSESTPSSSANRQNADNNLSNDRRSASTTEQTPPETAIIPIPPEAINGDKNVAGRVKLDLRQFQLKQGEQLQYMVRVYDSKNLSSNGQTQAGIPRNKDNNTADNGVRNPDGNPADAAQQQANASQNNSANSSNTQDARTGARAGNDTSREPANNAGNVTVRDAQENVNSASPRDPAGAPGDSQAAKGAEDSNDPGSDSSNASQQASRVTNNSNTNSSSQSPSSGGNSQQEDPGNRPNDQPPSQGQMAGARQPENEMTRRRLDVESQSAASSTMRIHIDEWAGTFDGQKRAKLEILIDPVLKELDSTLLKALEHLKPVSTALEVSKPLDEGLGKLLKATETQVERAQSLVGDLVRKTDGTPYAFIGLQLVDITELHISPARGEVKATSAAPEDKRKAHLQQAEFHLSRAREMLASLTKQYEAAKQNARLADNMQRLKRMYQVFVEDALATLGSGRPTLNPRDRKYAELELDEEFLKKYTDLQKRWQEILAELAKALAKDPRLLARYMNSSRKSVDTIRDQLTLLHNRQKEVAMPVDQLLAESQPGKSTEGVKKDAATVSAASSLLNAAHRRDLGDIAAALAEVEEDFRTWMPPSVKPDDPRVAAATELVRRAAATSSAASELVMQRDAAEAAVKKVDELKASMKALEDGLSRLAAESGDDAQLTEHANRRLAAVRRNQQLLEGWTEKNTHLKEKVLHRAVEIDQHRLAEDTLTLTDKLENMEAQLAGLPSDILDMADEIKQTMRFDVLVEQMNAELKLREADLPTAKDYQQRAIEGLARAESQFDKLIDRFIEEDDKVPPQVPDIDNMQLPTLEELLARLEAEAQLAELLGLPQRPTNLQQLRDWMMRNNGGQGIGSGANNRMNQMERARQHALRSMQMVNQPKGVKPAAINERRWNTLSSRLDDVLRQGRGNQPPKQYRAAIETYFDLISGAGGSSGSETRADAVKPDSDTDTKAESQP